MQFVPVVRGGEPGGEPVSRLVDLPDSLLQRVAALIPEEDDPNLLHELRLSCRAARAAVDAVQPTALTARASCRRQLPPPAAAASSGMQPPGCS